MERKARTRRTHAAAHPHLRHTTWDQVRQELRYEYFIYPPDARPYFPSDIVLRKLVDQLPGMEFSHSVRLRQRDYFSIFGYKRNPLAARAPAHTRRQGRTFLAEVTELALPARFLTPARAQACDEFMAEHGFKRLEWDGSYIDGIDYENRIVQGRPMRHDPRIESFTRLRLLLGKTLPFIYEAAQQ